VIVDALALSCYDPVGAENPVSLANQPKEAEMFLQLRVRLPALALVLMLVLVAAG